MYSCIIKGPPYTSIINKLTTSGSSVNGQNVYNTKYNLKLGYFGIYKDKRRKCLLKTSIINYGCTFDIVTKLCFVTNYLEITKGMIAKVLHVKQLVVRVILISSSM